MFSQSVMETLKSPLSLDNTGTLEVSHYIFFFFFIAEHSRDFSSVFFSPPLSSSQCLTVAYDFYARCIRDAACLLEIFTCQFFLFPFLSHIVFPYLNILSCMHEKLVKS